MISSETEQLRRSLKLYKGLVEVSALINAITDFNELLSSILEVAQRVMLAEASSLFLTNSDGDLELVIARGTAGEVKAPHIIVPRGQGIAGWVIENGKGCLVEDAYADPRFYQEVDKRTGFRTRSILCVPLTHAGSEIGVLQVLNPMGKNSFDEADLVAFGAYATLAATAIDKLRAIDRQKEQARVQQELSVANEIQTSFLPKSLPSIAALDCAASYSPARNIGGDFYDVRETGPDEIHFVIGDVSGKGIPAALLMAQALSTLRLILKPGTAPADALARWNGILCGSTIRGMFITAMVGRITPSKRLVEISSAGHCTPFLVRAGATGALELDVAGAPPVGIMPGMKYHATNTTMQPGEWLVFYTDGLTESFNAAREMLGSSGVFRILLQHPFSDAAGLVAALQKGEATHRLAADPHDDLTILAFGFR